MEREEKIGKRFSVFHQEERDTYIYTFPTPKYSDNKSQLQNLSSLQSHLYHIQEYLN